MIQGKLGRFDTSPDRAKPRAAPLDAMPKPRAKLPDSTSSRLSQEAIELVAARFRVLAEPNRLRLLQALSSGERNVTDLVRATGLSQANTSRHLQALANAGILGRRKQGLRVVYSIVDDGIFTLCHHVCESLRRRLERRANAFEG